MRIGIVLSQTPGYSETFFTSKIKGLQTAGFTVTLYTQKKAENFTLCPVVFAPKVKRFLPLQVLYMGVVFLSLATHLSVVNRFVRAERAENTSIGAILKRIFLNAHLFKAKLDWVHFGFATMALGSECVAAAIGAKMAVSFRGFDINVFPLKNTDCYNQLWNKVDKVHSISEYLYKKGLTLGLNQKTPFKIITPAVATESLPEVIQPNNEPIQIFTIARLNWIKGVDTAIAAMKILKQRGIRFEYHIVGDGSTKETERYAFQVFEAGLSDDVFFHGKLTHQETLEQLQKTDIYVQPSINEGFCNAVLEAQAMGKLVVASNVGGLPENVDDRKTGWLFKVEDAQDLAETIQEVLSLSETETSKISAAAVQHVKENFSIQQQQEQFVSFYTQEL